jgi:hypothetical protein
MKYKCHLIQACWEDEYQEYYYENGERVPDGEDIGVEITQQGKTKLYLLDGIKFPG